MSDPVRCHAGWHFPEHPQAVFWDGGWNQVLEAVTEWHTPQGYYFLVRCEQDMRFELKYAIQEDTWQVTLK